MTGTPTMDLILAAGTINTYDLAERISIAAQAGYVGLGLRPEDYSIARDNGHSDQDLRGMLADNGVKVIELQSVHGWAGDAEERAQGRLIEEGCYRLHDAIGGQYMMVSNTKLATNMADAIATFASICDRAASHGLEVAIEYLPWGPVPDAKTAWELVSAAGRDNAGVLVDSWHHFRGANDAEQIRAIPSARIIAVQIDDAYKEVRGASLYDDTRNERLNPGDGDFDLVGFVRLLDDLGVNVPYSVEVLSNNQRSLPPAVAAKRSADATWKVLAKARGLNSADYSEKLSQISFCSSISGYLASA